MKVLFSVLLLLPSLVTAGGLDGTRWAAISESGFNECPNFIDFHDDKYEVLNDCYGHDREKPIVENGTYLISNKEIKFLKPVCQQENLGLLNKCTSVSGSIIETKDNNPSKIEVKHTKYRRVD